MRSGSTSPPKKCASAPVRSSAAWLMRGRRQPDAGGTGRSWASVPFSVRIASRRPAALWLRDAFVGASVGWAVLLVVATYLAGRAHASLPVSALLVAVYGLGSIVCHQLPARSFHLWAAQMPVCARCAGIYGGAVLGALSALGAGRGARGAAARGGFDVTGRRARLLCGLRRCRLRSPSCMNGRRARCRRTPFAPPRGWLSDSS